MGKFEDVYKELNEWKFYLVGVTETHLKEEVRMDGSEFMMIGKGRKKLKIRRRCSHSSYKGSKSQNRVRIS